MISGLAGTLDGHHTQRLILPNGRKSMPLIGRVIEVWRYPVKSMRGKRLERCALGARDTPGDRGWARRDETAGEVRGVAIGPSNC